MQAVILAGGMGKRLLPLTASTHKVLLRIGDKPLLEHTIGALKENGIMDIVIVVSYKKEQIIEHFGNGSRFGVSIRYAEQDNPKGGTADAVRSASECVKGSFMLLNGDIFFHPSMIKQMLDSVEGFDGIIACKHVDNPKAFGVMEVGNGKILRILEKSDNPPSDIGNLGIYILPEEIFNAISKTPLSRRGEYELTDSINILIERGMTFKPVVVEGFWTDIGRIEDYKKANELHRERTKDMQ